VVRQAFPDGALWVDVNQVPDVADIQAQTLLAACRVRRGILA
jgi:hypothetical protein